MFDSNRNPVTLGLEPQGLSPKVVASIPAVRTPFWIVVFLSFFSAVTGEFQGSRDAFNLHTPWHGT